MPTTKTELLQGTLDLLILKTLAAGPLHGYAIAQRIQHRSDEMLVVEEGSLYPALSRWLPGIIHTCDASHPKRIVSLSPG